MSDPAPATHAEYLTEEHRETLGLALADAIQARCTATAGCTDCEDHPAGLCEGCDADLTLTDAYLALAEELGIEVPE